MRSPLQRCRAISSRRVTGDRALLVDLVERPSDGDIIVTHKHDIRHVRLHFPDPAKRCSFVRDQNVTPTTRLVAVLGRKTWGLIRSPNTICRAMRNPECLKDYAFSKVRCLAKTSTDEARSAVPPVQTTRPSSSIV